MITEEVTYSPVPTNGAVSLGLSPAPFLNEGGVVETRPGCPSSLGRVLEIPLPRSSKASFSGGT